MMRVTSTYFTFVDCVKKQDWEVGTGDTLFHESRGEAILLHVHTTI